MITFCNKYINRYKLCIYGYTISVLRADHATSLTSTRKSEEQLTHSVVQLVDRFGCVDTLLQESIINTLELEFKLNVS